MEQAPNNRMVHTRKRQASTLRSVISRDASSWAGIRQSMEAGSALAGDRRMAQSRLLGTLRQEIYHRTSVEICGVIAEHPVSLSQVGLIEQNKKEMYWKMNEQEKKAHWKCICGKESPVGTQYCPRCNRLLALYAEFVSDAPEPVIPAKPLRAEASPVDTGKAAGTIEEPEVEKTRHDRKKPKKRKSVAKFLLSVVLVLLVLLLAMLGLILSDRTNTSDIPSEQPSVRNTTPMLTMPTLTVPYETQPAQTEPPVTEPPVTEPPATEPPMTEPTQTTEAAENILVATINGEEITFVQTRAFLGPYQISVDYTAYNPRGEERYSIDIDIDNNLVPGSYHLTDSWRPVQVIFRQANQGPTYYSYGGSFDLISMNDDWTVYEGEFSAKLKPDLSRYKYMEINDVTFRFTLD